MASIYRRSYWATVDGQRVKRNTLVYYIKYRDADGNLQRVKGYKNKAKTQALAVTLEAEAARGPDPFGEHRRTPMVDHLKAYRQHLTTQNDVAKHVGQTCSAIEKVLEGCGFKTFDDLQVASVENWITEKRQGTRFGIKTANYHTKALKAFLNWMVRDGRAPSNPLKHLAELNAKVDVRRQRRSLSHEDFTRLVEAARKGKPYRGLSGPDRALLYEMAAYTGLRKEELASLTRTSLDLDAAPPTVTVAADKSKHRDEDVLPIRPDLADLLRDWMPAEGPLWPGTWHERASKMLQIDLAAARKAWIEEVAPAERPERERSDRLAYKDERGRYFDFHAQRGQFVSNLARAGVHPKVAQQLARHSTIHLTMANYTHLETADLCSGVQALPTLANHWPKNWPTEAENWPKNWPTVVDIGGQSQSLNGIVKQAIQETKNPLQDKGLEAVSRPLSVVSKCAPCRTRTYNPLIKSQML